MGSDVSGSAGAIPGRTGCLYGGSTYPLNLPGSQSRGPALLTLGRDSAGRSITDYDIKQLLRILVKALERFSDMTLIEAIIMCLTRVQPQLRAESPIHRALFWVAISVLQLDEKSLYACGLALLEQNLHTLDAHGAFDQEGLEEVMMSAREPLEWYFKLLDQSVGLSFKANFHFALVGHLMKGFRHPDSTTVSRTSWVLTMLLSIVAKPSGRDKFEVTQDNIAYMTVLVSVSEEVRSRCHLQFSVERVLSKASSVESFAVDLHLNLSMLQQQTAAADAKQSSSSASPSHVTPGSSGGSSPALREADTPPPPPPPARASRSHPLQGGGKASHELTDDCKAWRSMDLESQQLAQPTRPVFKTQRSSSVPTPTVKKEMQLQAALHRLESASAPSKERSARASVSTENNLLLAPDVLTDPQIQVLALTVLATLVKHSTDGAETRVLYEYLAEASIVFPRVFPVIHCLLDAKINQVLSNCYDKVILTCVQCIIQNMIATEHEAASQQLHSIQAYGFGGLWRFAGPFTKVGAVPCRTSVTPIG